jgi:hypothetical protein
MAIVYIHGVSVRDPAHGVALERPFQRWLSPRLLGTNAQALYLPVYWGDAGAAFRWSLRSRPKTFLLRQGGSAGFPGLGDLREAGQTSPLDRPVAATSPAGPVIGAGPANPERATPPLAAIPPQSRPDFLADLYLVTRPHASGADPVVQEPILASLADAAAAVAVEWNHIVSGASTDAERAARLLSAVDTHLHGGSELIKQGGFADWMSRAGETLSRAARWPSDAVSTVFAELRPAANELASYFMGDVFAYLTGRGDLSSPGEIPSRVLDALDKAHAHKLDTGEPIVVVTHSMGGQLFYDAITFFAASRAALNNLSVDYWFTCGSQVSFFAEQGLLKGQAQTREPQKLSRPPVGKWTNFFDRNDLFGYIMSPVFEGVTDVEYNTGYGLAFAHSGFLARPSFFEAMASNIDRK